MKCFVLAGGSGDALWPLSRKNYPKQFVNIRGGRSLFQEAIARNLPFCDEFFVITNYKYRYIVEGQLQAFQGLSYRLFLEEIGRQTAPAVTIAAMCVDATEEILVVSTDHVVLGGDYNGTIVKAKEMLADKDCSDIVVVGCEEELEEGHSAFGCEGGKVTVFYPNCMLANANCDDSKAVDVLLDSGIFMMQGKTYLEAINEYAPDLYEKCKNGNGRIRLENDHFVITKQWLSDIPSLSVGQCVFANCAGKNVSIVKAEFAWSRLLNAEVLSRLSAPYFDGPGIVEDSNNVSVLNEDENQLVVVNGCEDLTVINSKDAIYISKKGKSAGIRDIIEKHYEEQQDIFDEGDVFYTTWGIKETLNRSAGYTVKKLTIFPGKSISMHKHELRSEHWSIVSGHATITMGDRVKEFDRNESIFVPVGTFHKIENRFAEDLIVIEVSVGLSAGDKSGDILREDDDFVKLEPVFKDYIWGGTRLGKIYGKGQASEIIAESWELSAHKDGVCKIASGSKTGMDFTKYIESLGKSSWGWKCQPFEQFPMLVKFIDATNALSVQVHPDDEYAMSVENDYGKNEMWYVLDAKEDAAVYLGFSRDVTKEECQKRIEDGTLAEVLNRVSVKTGDVIFVKAGTVHAILDGLLILEIQQSSNATYRLYDYNRTDANGNKRDLHLEKAFENMSFDKYEYEPIPAGKKEQLEGYTKQLLGQCKYFSATAYSVEKEMNLSLDDASFSTLTFVKGEGLMNCNEKECSFKAGDSFFVPAGKKAIRIQGGCEFVLSRI